MIAKSVCLSKTHYSYTGNKKGCGRSYSNKSFQIKRVDWLALARSVRSKKTKSKRRKSKSVKPRSFFNNLSR